MRSENFPAKPEKTRRCVIVETVDNVDKIFAPTSRNADFTAFYLKKGNLVDKWKKYLM